LALCVRFIMFIDDLMRMLEEVSGDTLSPYLRRAIGLEALRAELSALADRLAHPDFDADEYHADSGSWGFAMPTPPEDWRFTPPLVHRKGPISLYALLAAGARGPLEIFEKAAPGAMPLHAHIVS
jgi:hypothetical protein